MISNGTPTGGYALSELTFDGTYLNLGGAQRIQTDLNSSVSSSAILYQVPATIGKGANFDYYVEESGGAKRMGTIMSVWDSLGSSWTDISTPDLNSSTAGISFTVTVSGGNVNFNSVVTSGTWEITLSVRIIY